MNTKRFAVRRMSLLLAAYPAAVLAQDANLGEVSVYGERPAAFRNITTSTETATKELIEHTNVVNTEDAVKYLPSIQIRKRFVGDRNAIVSSRNSGTLDSARSLVYADNVLVSNLLGNSYSFAPRWWFVSPEEIERVDVSYGAHSAAYAGNAAGVVMVMKSRLPESFEANADAQAFRQNFSLYGTDKDYGGSRLGAYLGNRHGDLRWTFAFNHFENTGQPMSFATGSRPAGTSGGYDDKDPKNQPRTILGAYGIDRTVQDNAKIKLAYDFSPDSRLTYTLGRWRNDSDADVQSYLTKNVGGAPYYASSLQKTLRNEEHTMNSLAYRFDPKQASDWAFELALTDYDIGTDRTLKPTVSGGNIQSNGTVQLQDGTGWRTADLRADWRPERGKRGHDFAFGYHYDQHVLSDRTYNASNWLAGNAGTLSSANAGKTDTQAIYVQDAIRLGSDWKMTLGARHEQWRAFDGSKSLGATTVSYAGRNESYTSPKFSLAWTATDDWLLRGSLSRAARFPTVTELFQGTISGTSIINNDPNLKPERILAGELAAERDLAGLGNLRVSLFQDNLTDALIRQTNTTVSPTVTNVQNVDKARVRGIEMAVQRHDVFIHGLDLLGSLTYADSEILANEKNPASVGKRMLRIPDWRATLAATWRANDNLNLTLAGRYSGRQFGEVDNSDVNDRTYGGSSRFLVIDAKANYRLDKNWALAVGVDNLTNEHYYAYHPYTQRMWIAQLKYTMK